MKLRGKLEWFLDIMRVTEKSRRLRRRIYWKDWTIMASLRKYRGAVQGLVNRLSLEVVEIMNVQN